MRCKTKQRRINKVCQLLRDAKTLSKGLKRLKTLEPLLTTRKDKVKLARALVVGRLHEQHLLTLYPVRL